MVPEAERCSVIVSFQTQNVKNIEASNNTMFCLLHLRTTIYPNFTIFHDSMLWSTPSPHDLDLKSSMVSLM
nr:hypothetical protein CFP56_50980 [Quercus suber]